MDSLLYTYFVPKIILILIVVFIGYWIMKKELPKWLLICYVPISMFLIGHSLWGPHIVGNINLHKKLINLDSKEVKKINVFEKGFKGNYHNQYVRGSLKEIKSNQKIEEILGALIKKESYWSNRGGLDNIYGMDIILNDNSRINFTLLKADNNLYVNLLKEFNGQHYTIGTYKKNSLIELLKI